MANENHSQTADMSFNRRSSVTSAALSNLFRSNSASLPSTSTSAGTSIFPGPITSAALDQNRRRRLSIATTSTLGLSGASPVSAGATSSGQSGAPAAGLRRASMSTASSSWSEAIDENAIEEDDGPSRATPNSPFARRMSFGAQAMRNIRGPGGASPGASSGRPRSIFSSTTGAGAGKHQHPQHQPVSSSASSSGSRSQPSPATGTNAASTSSPSHAFTSTPSPRTTSSPFSPPSSASVTSRASFSAHSPRVVSDKFSFPVARADQGYNWSEQLRSRAESTVHGQRASFSFGSGSGSSPPRHSIFGGVSAGGGLGAGGGVGHDRTKSVSEPAAPAPAAPRPRRNSRPKPDHFQERILKGDFYMD